MRRNGVWSDQAELSRVAELCRASLSHTFSSPPADDAAFLVSVAAQELDNVFTAHLGDGSAEDPRHRPWRTAGRHRTGIAVAEGGVLRTASTSQRAKTQAHTPLSSTTA